MKYLLGLLLAVALIHSQYPQSSNNIIYNQAQAQPNLCYSMCLTCQTSNLSFCNSCEVPYLKTIPPICNITSEFNMVGWELWESTVGSGVGGTSGLFTPSPYWATNTPNAASRYCGQHLVYGPFGTGSILTYSRPAPAHDYIIIKFFFVRINWAQTDSVTFSYLGTATNNTLALPLSYVGNGTSGGPAATTLLGACDINFNNQTAPNDMVSSLELKFFDKNLNPSLFNASFVSSSTFSTTAAWALNTFFVISGLCHPTCYTCNYDVSPTACLVCVGLLSQATDRSCSICGAGKYQITPNQCGLCPINCTLCSSNTSTLLCTACPDTMTLTASGTCEYSSTSNNYLVTALEANTQNFPSSFWTITPTPNQNQTISTCGIYSYVGGSGLTSPNSRISRVFSTLPPHVSLSVRLNYLKVDRTTENSNVLRIYIDGQLIDNQTILLSGSSNECGQPYVDTVASVETSFTAHSNTNDVNITFASDASSWGIRDVMVVINNCGANCALCTSAGCQACSGFLRLVGVTCIGCQVGFVAVTNSICIACDTSCMSCEAVSGNCTSCYSGFIILNGRCILGNAGWVTGFYDLTTFGNSSYNPFTYSQNSSSSLFGGPLNQLTSSNTSSINIAGWSYNAVSDSNILSCQYVDLSNPSYTSSNGTISYLVSQNNSKKTFSNLPPHSRVRIMYTLMKIDNWGSDPLDLYLNDLLVNQDIFQGDKQGGSNVCGSSTQNEYIYTGDITINDSNSTLTVEFDAETLSGNARYFGIKNLVLMFYNCENCDSQTFFYKLDYTVNNTATVYVEFNHAIQMVNYGLGMEQVFQLYLNGKRLNYTSRQVPHNNKLWLLDFNPGVISLVDGNLSLLSSYPSAVVTSGRVAGINGGLQNVPVRGLDNSLASVSFKRFDIFETTDPYRFRQAFNALTKILFFCSLFSFVVGWQSAFIGPIHNLQFLWLHIYVASKYIPSNLKVALEGFRYIQNLNFFSNNIQDRIGFGVTADNVLFDSPAEYMAYHYDVSFFRNVYAIAIFAGMFWIIFGLLIMLFRSVPMLRLSMCWLIRYYRYLTNRVMWLLDSLFMFQFVTLCFAIFAQFQDTRILASPYSNLQLGGAIIALIFVVAWPLLQALFIRSQIRDPNFNYYYGEIHYRFFKNREHYFSTWRILCYQLYRYGQIFWVCIVFALLYSNYYAQVILLILTFAFHITFIAWGGLYNVPHCSVAILKVLQLISFVGLEVIIIVCYSSYQTLSHRSYIQLGYAGVFFCVMVVVCSFVRMLILLFFRCRFMRFIPEMEVGMLPVGVATLESQRMLPMPSMIY